MCTGVVVVDRLRKTSVRWRRGNRSFFLFLNRLAMCDLLSPCYIFVLF